MKTQCWAGKLTFAHAIQFPGQKMSMLGSKHPSPTHWKRWGAKPPHHFQWVLRLEGGPLDPQNRRFPARKLYCVAMSLPHGGKFSRRLQTKLKVSLNLNRPPQPDEAKTIMNRAVPTNRHEPIPIDFGLVDGCFGHDPKHLNCEIAQPTAEKNLTMEN